MGGVVPAIGVPSGARRNAAQGVVAANACEGAYAADTVRSVASEQLKNAQRRRVRKILEGAARDAFGGSTAVKRKGKMPSKKRNCGGDGYYT